MEYMYLKLCNLKEAEQQTDNLTGLRLPAASFSLKTRSFNSFTYKKFKKSILYNQAPIAHLLSVGLLNYRSGFDPRSRQIF